MKKTYDGFKISIGYILISLGAILVLLGSIYAVFTFDKWYYTVLLIISIAFIVFWIIGSASIIKTRIVLDEKSLRAAFHIWYDGFKATAESKIAFKTISYEDMKSVDVIFVTIEIYHKEAKALKIELKDQMILLLLLDGLNQEESEEVIKYVKMNVDDSYKNEAYVK